MTDADALGLLAAWLAAWLAAACVLGPLVGRWLARLDSPGSPAAPAVSGRLDPTGGGWCWYCGLRHERAATKRTPCCGDCWDDAPPEAEPG